MAPIVVIAALLALLAGCGSDYGLRYPDAPTVHLREMGEGFKYYRWAAVANAPVPHAIAARVSTTYKGFYASDRQKTFEAQHDEPIRIERGEQVYTTGRRKQINAWYSSRFGLGLIEKDSEEKGIVTSVTLELLYDPNAFNIAGDHTNVFNIGNARITLEKRTDERDINYDYLNP